MSVACGDDADAKDFRKQRPLRRAAMMYSSPVGEKSRCSAAGSGRKLNRDVARVAELLLVRMSGSNSRPLSVLFATWPAMPTLIASRSAVMMALRKSPNSRWIGGV